MASDIWLRTILVVRKETCCRHIGYFFRLTARVLLYAPSHIQDSTYHSLCYTSRGALAGMRNSSMGPPHEGSIRQPIAPWVNALITELHLAPTPRNATFSLYRRWSEQNRTQLTGLEPVGAYKRTLAVYEMSSPSGGSGFPISLSEWSFTICLIPYVLSASLNKNISFLFSWQFCVWPVVYIKTGFSMEYLPVREWDGAMGCLIDPAWWTHRAASHSNQCSISGVTKAVVCVILSVGWCIPCC